MSITQTTTTEGIMKKGVSTTSQYLVVSVSTNKHEQASFSISRLPPELRHKIYACYFESLPSLNVEVENTNINSPYRYHLYTPLALASPFFEYDVPASLFYSCCTFSFASGKAMRGFAAEKDGGGVVRRVKVVCRKEARDWDWVYLVNVCCEGLEEVTCELGEWEADTDCDCFAGWWECVRDAMREG